jgi:hypothetical protein
MNDQKSSWEQAASRAKPSDSAWVLAIDEREICSSPALAKSDFNAEPALSRFGGNHRNFATD